MNILLVVPAHFTEIFILTFCFIACVLFFQSLILQKGVSLSHDFAYRLRKDSDPCFNIVFVPNGNKTYYKSEIPRLGNQLFFIPKKTQEFPFRKDEIVNGVKFNGKISIIPGSNSAYTNYFERISNDETKKTELSFWDMRHIISLVLERPNTRTCKAVFFMYLKAELCNVTCFDWEDFDIKELSFELN